MHTAKKPAIKKKGVWILGGENGGGDVYHALHHLPLQDLRDFVESNNIGRVFFEFLPNNDFPLVWKPCGNRRKMALTFDRANLLYDGPPNLPYGEPYYNDASKYSNIRTFGEFLGKEGFEEAASGVPKLAFNAQRYTNMNPSYNANIAPVKIRAAQISVAEKFARLGIEVEGLETPESFFAATQQKPHKNRFELLNNGGAKVVRGALLELGTKNALIITDNACLGKGGMQDRFGENFHVHPVAFCSPTTAKSFRDFDKRVVIATNKDDFWDKVEAGKAGGGKRVSFDSKVCVKPPTVLNFESSKLGGLYAAPFPPKDANCAYRTDYLQPAQGQIYEERRRLRKALDLKYTSSFRHDFKHMDVNTWLAGFSKEWKGEARTREEKAALKARIEKGEPLNSIFQSSRLNELKTSPFMKLVTTSVLGFLDAELGVTMQKF